MRSIHLLRQKSRSQTVKSQEQSPPKESLERHSVGPRRSREAEVPYFMAFLMLELYFENVSPSLM